MALSTTTVAPAAQPAPQLQPSNDLAAPLLGALIISVYAANKGTRQFRKLRRQFLWTTMKLKAKSLFSRQAISNKTLIYILLGVVALALLAINPLLTLAVALIALILILAGAI